MKKKNRVKYSISFKFITIFAILLSFFFALSTFMVYYFLGTDLNKKEIKENNQINNLIAQNVQTTFQELQNNVNGYFNGIMLLQDDVLYEEKANLLFNDLCYRNPEIDFVYTTSTGAFSENKFLSSHPEVQEVFVLWIEKQDSLKKKIISGRPCVKNISQLYNEGVICLLYPYINSRTKQTEIAAIGINARKYSELVGLNTENPTFVIAEDGVCILNPDYSQVTAAKDFSELPFVKEYFEKKNESEKIQQDEYDVKRYYDITPISGSTMFVITSFIYGTIQKYIENLLFRIILVGVFIFFLGLFVILIFSRKISKSIERLVFITRKIENKDYKIRLKTRTHDEVGYLTESVNKMQDVLLERQLQNQVFNKYSNSFIAEKVVNGEQLLSGINKNASVLYLNVKDFSKQFGVEDSPKAVKVLNELYTQVAGCVEKTGGYVDNFYGDTLVAMWGTVQTTGSPVSDAWNCVRCALLIRVAVYEINMHRQAQGKSLIQVCMGISSGIVTSAEIGFPQRTDYTAFGSVIMDAKKVRNMGKAFGTDIFITKATYDLVCSKIVTEQLTGDAEIQDIYAVINAIGLKGPGNTEDLKNFLELIQKEIRN